MFATVLVGNYLEKRREGIHKFGHQCYLFRSFLGNPPPHVINMETNNDRATVQTNEFATVYRAAQCCSVFVACCAIIARH